MFNTLSFRSQVLILFCGLALLVLAGAAHGQGFLVSPARMEFAPETGDEVTQNLTIRNTSTFAVSVTITPSLLGQTPVGLSNPLDPKIRTPETAALRPCYDWMKVEQDRVTVPALDRAVIPVKLTVPRSARGYYSAVLVLDSVPPVDDEDERARLTVRFLVPVLVDVQGPLARERLLLDDMSMEYHERTPLLPADSVCRVKVQNAGETMLQLQARVSVEALVEGRWYKVTDAKPFGFLILPGVTLDMPHSLGRRLPSGRYKVRTSLWMNGREKTRGEREIDFIGDPTAKLPFDVALIVNPTQLDVKTLPGGLRTAIITLQNPTAQTVQVAARAAFPPELKGVALGNVRGDEFDCSAWMRVDPPMVELRGNSRQNIKVTFMPPRGKELQPNCYANIEMKVVTTDGQSVGDISVPVWAQTSAVEDLEPAIHEGLLTISREEGDIYAVNAQFENIGNVHFLPEVSIKLLTQAGRPVQIDKLDTDITRVLPLGRPQYTGALDFSTVAPGTYLVLATLTAGGKQVNSSLPIRVELDGEQKVITVIKEEPANPEPSET